MKNLPGLSPIWLISLAMVLGVFLSVAIPLVVSTTTINSTAWIGFAGSIIGGAIAIFALYMATQNVRRQLRTNLLSREEERMEAELPKLLEVVDFLRNLSALKPDVPLGQISMRLLEAFPPRPTPLWHDRLKNRLPSADGQISLQLATAINLLYAADRRWVSAWTKLNKAKDALREQKAGTHIADLEEVLNFCAEEEQSASNAVRIYVKNVHRIRDQILRRIELLEDRLPIFRREIEEFFHGQ